LFADEGVVRRSQELTIEREMTRAFDMAIIEGGVFAKYQSVSGLLSALPSAIMRAIVNRVSRA
jgi:hypothetical protein